MRQPIGITLLSIYYFFGGLGAAICAIGLFIKMDDMVRLIRSAPPDTFIFSNISSGQVPTVVHAMIAFFVVFAVLYLTVAAGLRNLEPWAWTLTVALYSGGLVSSAIVVSSGVFNGVVVSSGEISSVDFVPGFVVNLAILIYLFRPGVRHAFAD
jgi:hypothetical protein